MKQLKSFLLLLFGTVVLTTLVSCEKDDPVNNNAWLPPEYNQYFPENPSNLLPIDTYFNSEWKSVALFRSIREYPQKGDNEWKKNEGLTIKFAGEVTANQSILLTFTEEIYGTTSRYFSLGVGEYANTTEKQRFYCVSKDTLIIGSIQEASGPITPGGYIKLQRIK
jgi:hypothetical protein